MSADFIEMVAYLSEHRLLRTMQSLVAKKTPCAIFFAPAIPANARQIVNSLKGSGVNLNCICVLSNEHKKFLQPAEGEYVVVVEEFPNLSDKPKFIFSFGGFFPNMFMDYFGRFGAEMIHDLNVNGAENFYNFYMAHLPELYVVHEMLADDESKKVFRAAIIGNVTKILQDFRFAPEPQYFLNGFLPTTGDIAIDGGAYDGNTAADFVRQGAQVYAFEMDAKNYQNCIKPAEKFGFMLENLGLSNRAGEAFYSGDGAGSRKLPNTSADGVIGHFIDLDSYVEQKNLPRVDYIKLDIEGSELDMLHGATKTISRWKPKMAVSVYHKPEDLWTLPTYIKSLRADYELQFRHYQANCINYLPFTDDEKEIIKHCGLNCFCANPFEKVLYCR